MGDLVLKQLNLMPAFLQFSREIVALILYVVPLVFKPIDFSAFPFPRCMSSVSISNYSFNSTLFFLGFSLGSFTRRVSR